jgi:diguanylate cyclase (GGDEF)-like protein
MQKKKERFLNDDEPQKLATDLIIGKNRWLTRIRWFYTNFILIFFISYNYITGSVSIHYRDMALIVALSIIGNIIFTFALNRHVKLSLEDVNRETLSSLASIQLDFDLVILSLLVFLSGGIESPIIVLFIFYIMLSTFLIHHKKAFKNTVTAMILVVVIFFANEGLIISLKKLTTMIAFNVILLFAYLISAYLSRNLRENEKKLQELLEKFRELSVNDRLTDLYNQAHFFLLLNLQLERAKRYKNTFSIIIFDVDNFKDYNDTNGHIAGSEALRKVGRLMKKVFRSSDVLCRYGGDEYVVILPNSDHVGAFLGAERIRETVENEHFKGGEHQPLGKVTLSLGISSYPEHGTGTKDLLNKADKALYIAKNTGRNKTVIYTEDLEEE